MRVHVYSVYNSSDAHSSWRYCPFFIADTYFALGAGTTMIRTPIIPTMSALVSRSEMPAALTLSAVASNIGRAVGPTVGGFIGAAIAPWAVFFLNSASFSVMIIVLSKLPRKSQASCHQRI
jgi:MFS family permease